MNTKNNKRRRESIERIENVFFEMLQAKELNEIKIADICKKCGLNRSTFYANYTDIYDLADKVRLNLEADVKELYSYETTNKINSNDYLKLFRHIKENRGIYLAYFKLGYDSSYRTELYDTRQAKHDFDNKHIDYHMEFFKSGLNAIIKMWIDGGCKESPEEMEEIILSEYKGRAPI